MGFNKIDVSTEKFDGFARVIIFPEVDPDDYTSTTDLADVLKGGIDLGQIVDESYSWDGDEASVDTLKDTEGGVIRALATPGTLAWSCRLPSTSAAMSKTIAGAKTTDVGTSDKAAGDVKLAKGKSIILLDPANMTKSCPIGVLDSTHKKLWLYPKATVVTTPTLEDSMLEYSLSATAETVSTDTLATMMIIPLAEDPLTNTVASSAGA
jgi:hypothetical protein